jgi:hypothetical protein
MCGMGGLVSKVMATGALLVLGTAMGYSLGVQQGIESSREQRTNLTVEPAAIASLEEAARQARERGDPETAMWIDEAVKANRERLLEWSTANAHGAGGRVEVRRVTGARGG